MVGQGPQWEQSGGVRGPKKGPYQRGKKRGENQVTRISSRGKCKGDRRTPQGTSLSIHTEISTPGCNLPARSERGAGEKGKNNDEECPKVRGRGYTSLEQDYAYI